MARIVTLTRLSSTLSLSCALLFGCGGGGVEDDFGSVEQAVQIEYVTFNNQTSTSRWVNLLFSDSQSTGGKNVGALRFQDTTGPTPRPFYSCGVTFISPTYAVTAAHCLVGAPSTFKVEQYNTTNLYTINGILKLGQQAGVSGTWPNWTRNATLSSADGYVVTTYTDCSTAVACDSAYVRTNCPFPENVDVALVRCPSRDSSSYAANYTAVRTDDPSNKEVEVWWFHELLDLAGDPGEETPSQPASNWNNYGLYSTNNNYHYSTGTHQLLPMRSTSWNNGPFYKQNGHLNTEITKTDVPVCHGTSGSGVFERGTTTLFGVVADWGTNSVNGEVAGLEPDRLCEDMDSKTANSYLMGHTRSTWARQLQAMSIVQADRQ